MLGLAPAAHGANRTGRVFTGDRSGDFLFAVLHRAAFAVPGARAAVAAGAVVVDNSSAWRMDPDVPLVVTEVNADALGTPRAQGGSSAGNPSRLVALRSARHSAIAPWPLRSARRSSTSRLPRCSSSGTA